MTKIRFVNNLYIQKKFKQSIIMLVLYSKKYTLLRCNPINKDTLRIVARHCYHNSIIKLLHYTVNGEILI